MDGKGKKKKKTSRTHPSTHSDNSLGCDAINCACSHKSDGSSDAAQSHSWLLGMQPLEEEKAEQTLRMKKQFACAQGAAAGLWL